MTDTITAPVMRRTRMSVFSILRTALCSLFLSALVAGCLYLYHTAIPFLHERLLAEEMKTFAWFAEQLGFSLPFIVICLFHGIAYHKHDHHDGVARREMLWEVIWVTVFVYAVLLPSVANLSEAMYETAFVTGADIPKTEGGVPRTLLIDLHDWFIRLSIPLALLMVYHGTRASRELNHPETEAEEPVITVAEYEARMNPPAEETAVPEEEVLQNG